MLMRGVTPDTSSLDTVRERLVHVFCRAMINNSKTKSTDLSYHLFLLSGFAFTEGTGHDQAVHLLFPLSSLQDQTSHTSTYALCTPKVHIY